MIRKVVILVLLVLALGAAGYYFYENIPGKPEIFNVTLWNNSQSEENVSYGDTPLFYKNIRFNHNNLSYSFSGCSSKRMDSIKSSMDAIAEKTLLSFYEINNGADIDISCDSGTSAENEDAGKGGPKNLVDTGIYLVIVSGNITLYDVASCNNNVELHEILHVLGFNHSQDPENIMYPISGCRRFLKQDIINTLNRLYGIKPLPDLFFDGLSAVRKGRYIDFTAEIRNQGIINSGNFALSLIAENDVQKFDFDSIGFGAGSLLNVTNALLPNNDVREIRFVIDYDNAVEEYSKENNKADLSI